MQCEDALSAIARDEAASQEALRKKAEAQDRKFDAICACQRAVAFRLEAELERLNRLFPPIDGCHDYV